MEEHLVRHLVLQDLDLLAQFNLPTMQATAIFGLEETTLGMTHHSAQLGIHQQVLIQHLQFLLAEDLSILEQVQIVQPTHSIGTLDSNHSSTHRRPTS
jgi:hypothetical protein